MDDWQSKTILGMIPIVMACTGWVFSLESRVQVIDTRQQERTARLISIETIVNRINDQVLDPKPKPETRVEVANIRQDIDRLREDIFRVNDRVDRLRQCTPHVNPPYNPGNTRRGDLIFEYPQKQP